MSAQGNTQEYLLYTYYFVESMEHSIGWTYFIERDPIKGERGYISKSRADSILYSWGFKKQALILNKDTLNNFLKKVH